jgi:hypothetical protein
MGLLALLIDRATAWLRCDVLFFVSVNQVLVRLWARVYSIGLTDKRVLRDFAVSGDLSGSSDY